MKPRGLPALALAAVLLVAAALPGWQWDLPAGVAPPRVPADNAMSAAKVELGRRLFYDADLSVNGTMACATCHEQHRAFTEGNAMHPGVQGDPGRRNVPGLANVAYMRSLTWGDPRIVTLEAQADVPVLGLHPVEMGMAGQEAEIARRLSADTCYRSMFLAAFPERAGRIDQVAIRMALGSFERTLISFAAPVDRGVAGLDSAARQGATLFQRDCAACHGGPLYSDGRFHALGAARGEDRGLGEITGRKADDGKFRTPSLRNVALTGPYLHDGSATTLALAIAAHPGARSAADTALLITYLDALTDTAFVHDPRFGYPDTACGRRL